MVANIEQWIQALIDEIRLLQYEEIQIGMITISIGAARTKGVKQSKQLFEKADKALYIAKEKGKNSYAIDGGEDLH